MHETTLHLHLSSNTKSGRKLAARFLDISLTLKHPFVEKRRRNYTQRDGKYGQSRDYIMEK